MNTSFDIEKINLDSSQSIRNSNKILQNSLVTSTNILAELNKQGDQIKNAENSIDNIKNINKRAEGYINSIKSLFGSIVNKFSTPLSLSLPLQLSPNNSSLKNRHTPIIQNKDEQEHDYKLKYEGGEDGDEFNEYSILENRISFQLKEQDDGLDYMLNSLKTLHVMSLDMNNEIDIQTKKLKKLAQNVEEQELKIKDNNKKIQQLL